MKISATVYNFSKQKIHSVMALWLVTKLLWITCFVIASYALPVSDRSDAAGFLEKFGYLEQSAAALSDPGAITTAIRDFQKFVGLGETGQLDGATIAKMNSPRCGMKDKLSSSARKRRYALAGSKWDANELTYHISKYSSSFRDSIAIKNEIIRAFQAWSDVTPLNFRENAAGQADIDIRFEVGNHGDWSPFDGPGRTLAHAFYPQNGDAHFDDDETWTINDNSGINLLKVAVHEFGHSLGLSHSSVQGAIMFPYISGYVPRFELHSDDVQGIQALYGPPPSDRNNAPNLCQDASIDAITRTLSGNTYVFKGNFYWKVLSNGIAAGYPRSIPDEWNGLEGNLDAAVTANSHTYFFKGSKFWRFTNGVMDGGFPQLISSGFPGIPDNLHAALVWSGNGKTYFFKGSNYWRYDFNSNPPVSAGYPQPITEWSSSLADGIDAGLTWDNNQTYIFKGAQYYRYNDETSEVYSGYPLSTAAEWFRCQ